MTTVPKTDTRTPDAVAEIRAAAITALDAWAVRSRQEAEELLLFWRRRAEMTDNDVAAVLAAVFPDTARFEWGAGFAEGFLAGMQAARRSRDAR
jgi:hypothetical protein